ncbi:LysR family transcriptional regulator [Polaromonas sp.]|uniref:LysR family transcriptional regulator n=1 Tax=Polaromonas sp. TaxID=1869339 RepID=UPI00286C10C2|nr:LysR family transcriptional regulator [Polaromonas sp.]
MLDIKLLRLLDQLYSTRSVTRSAEALGQSQPTVSIWLARLRKELGDPLFVRSAEGMLPTPRTDALIATVREVLNGLQRLAQSGAAFDAATAQRRFAICMTDASHITLLPRLLAHVRALAPGVVLQAKRIDADLAQALQAGEADLALGFLPWLDTGFYQQTLYAQDWICLANAQHPRVIDATPAHWNLAVYQAEAHIGISAGTGYQLLDSTVAAQHLTRQIRLELPGFLGLSAILSTSDLIATLPRHIGETLARASGPNGLRVLPCPFEIQGFTVKQYWHARYHHDAASRWLRGVCAELFMESGSSPGNAGATSYLFDSAS